MEKQEIIDWILKEFIIWDIKTLGDTYTSEELYQLFLKDTSKKIFQKQVNEALKEEFASKRYTDKDIKEILDKNSKDESTCSL